MPKIAAKKIGSPRKASARFRGAGHPVPGLTGPLLQFNLAEVVIFVVPLLRTCMGDVDDPSREVSLWD